MTIIYEKKDENSYVGGFSLISYKNIHLGGNHNNITSRYEKMVTPFGLYYNQPLDDLNNEEVYSTENDVNEEEYHYENINEDTECIHPELFDKLFYFVGKIELPKREKYHHKKTRKNKRK
jgi:hypothetical protein